MTPTIETNPRYQTLRHRIDQARAASKAAATEAERLQARLTEVTEESERAEAMHELGRLRDDGFNAAQRRLAETERDFANAKREASVQRRIADELEASLDRVLASGTLDEIEALRAEALPEAVETLLQGLSLLRSASDALDNVQARFAALQRDTEGLVGTMHVQAPALGLWHGLKYGAARYLNGRTASGGIDMPDLVKRIRDAGFDDLCDRYGL